MPHVTDFDPEELPTGRHGAWFRDLNRLASEIDTLAEPERELLLQLVRYWVACDNDGRAVVTACARQLAPTP